jgi:aminoglycoside/choline kinase family phosphotransferase
LAHEASPDILAPMQDLMPPKERAQARADFLRRAGQASATLQPLPVDASFRRYFRLAGSRPPILLMDAPPPGEDVRPFVRIAQHLAGLGLSPPAIFEIDEDRGFLLIEDFGEGTFTRLMDAGADARPLFAAATDALVVLHTHPSGANVTAPAYDHRKLLDEVSELPDWYGPAIGTPPAAEPRAAFMEAWESLLHALPPPVSALVLLDFHVDNLMWLPGRPGAKACGLLDFQDARIGPSPYDLMTLLRNERRGIDPALSDALLDRYVAAVAPADPEAFGVWYRVLAAQRYAKVLGRFARLTLRDGRDGYLRYLPRVAALLSDALADDPVLRPVRVALDAMLPHWRVPPPDDPAAVRRRVALSAGRP